MFPAPAWDYPLQMFFNQELRSPVLDVAMPLLSSRALLFVILSGLLVWRCAKLGKSQALYFILLALCMGASDLATNQVKHAVGRVRPEHSIAGTYYRQGDTWQRLPSDFQQQKQTGPSFPSAHAANSAALALLAALLWPRLRACTWALPALVGWSRLYLGKHFPTDILGGWALGVLVALLFWQLWKVASRRMNLSCWPGPAY